MPSADLVRALFAPRCVALVGASGDPEKNTSRPQRYLRKHGYRGRIVPVNPNREEVLGERAYPNLSSAPGPIDHAFVMVPTAAVADIIAECAAAGIPVATIYSNGFAEAGEEGRRRQQAVVDVARAGGVRLVGPNSMGLIDTRLPLALSVNAALETPELAPGSLGVVSQSGTVLGTLLSRGQARGLGFSKLVSIGNEADLGVGEIVDLLVDDPDTTAILLFLETIRNAGGLAAAARRALAAGKPVIAYKLGRSGVGRELAMSHSGALAGPDEAVNAYFRHHGVLRVDMLETMVELPLLVIGRGPAKGRRVAIVTTTGGGGAMVADRLGTFGIAPAPAPERLVERLRGMGVQLGHGPLIDLTMAGARTEVYRAALEELIASAECDAVVAVVGSSGQFRPEVAVEPILSTGRTERPVAAFLVPQADRSLRLLVEAGIAAFRTPESCADAVRTYLDWSPPGDEPTAEGRDTARAEAALAAARGPILDEWESRRVFEALGVPQAPARLVRDPSEASGLRLPVAAKIVSRDIAHKTEAGGVILDIGNAADLRAACERILTRVRGTHPAADIAGVLVQSMERGLAEALVGYRRDPEVGPVVVLGVGGTLAEIYRDVSVRMAPVSTAVARDMIEEVKGLAPIRGYRALPPGDCETLAEAVAALSDLARVTGRTVLEAEINPLVVKAEGEGVVAVDGFIRCEPAAAAPPTEHASRQRTSESV